MRGEVRYTLVDPQRFDWDAWLTADEGDEGVDHTPDSPAHRQQVAVTAVYGAHTVTRTYTIITTDPTYGPYRARTINTPEEATS